VPDEKDLIDKLDYALSGMLAGWDEPELDSVYGAEDDAAVGYFDEAFDQAHDPNINPRHRLSMGGWSDRDIDELAEAFGGEQELNEALENRYRQRREKVRDFSPEGTRKARERAAREASEEAKRALELQPAQGPLRWASATQRDWQAEAAQDPSEYIMEAERPGSFDEPRLSDQFRGSKGGITRHEDDLFQTLLKGDRNDLIDLRERNPIPFRGLGAAGDRSRISWLEALPEAKLRTELVNEYLGKAADNFDIPPGGPGGRSTWTDMPGHLKHRQNIGDPAMSAADLAEDIARPGTKMGDIGWEAGEWAVESRSFERMVNAAKKAGVHLSDDILKLAKGFGKAGLKAIPIAGLAADFADIPEAQAGTVGSEFESAPEARARQQRDIESEEFLAEQPPSGMARFAGPGGGERYAAERFGEEPEEEADYSPEGVRKSRDAAAKKAMEK